MLEDFIWELDYPLTALEVLIDTIDKKSKEDWELYSGKVERKMTYKFGKHSSEHYYVNLYNNLL